MAWQTIRLKPEQPVRCGDYDLDACALEFDPESQRFDFRLEFGAGLGIYWALPAGPNDRLRLAHVDGAAYTLEEPVLLADPWTCDLAIEWTGSLAMLEDGSELLAVRLECTTNPPAYHCRIATYWGPRDLDRTYELAWSGESSPPAPPKL